jgi:hypothetical protein
MPCFRVPPCRQSCRGSWLGLSPAPVVGLLVGAEQRTWSGGKTPWPRKLPDTLLGPETTGPFFPGPCVGWEACCCLTGFGGGVWCLICG